MALPTGSGIWWWSRSMPPAVMRRWLFGSTMRPGITGFWQVSKRNDSTFAERADFDDRYDREVSLATDLRLLAATVGVVLRATGH